MRRCRYRRRRRSARRRTFNVSYGSTASTSDTDATSAAVPADGDYDNDAAPSVVFGASETAKNISIPITDDNIEEGAETFTVTIAPAAALPDGFALGNASTTVTITDNDTATLSVAAPSAVTEGDSGGTDMVFTVTLDSLSAQQVTVDYAVDAASTATSGTDHAALADGTLTFPAGTATQTVTVSVTGDELDETDETVVINLSNPANAVLGTAKATGTITDDDASPSLTAIADVSLRVGQTVDITASATDADTGDTISYAWTRKENEDTPALPGPPNLSQARLTFVPTATGTYTMTVTASDGAGNSDTEEVVITVTPALGVTVTPTALTVVEGASATYTVKLNAAPSGNVTVTVSGATGDVTVSGSPMTFTAQNYGEAQTVTVNAASDTDATNDTAALTHSATGGGYNDVTIAGVDVTVTDTTPVLQLRKDPAAVTEGTAISLEVTSDKARTGTLAVSLTLAARGSAGFDANDIPGTLGPRNFNAVFGATPSTKGTVTIPTSSDSTAESAETYRITLNDTDDYELGADKTADGVLNDPAAGVSLSIADASAAENVSSGTLSFTVTASKASSSEVTFKYAVTAESGDTATAGTDFTAVAASAKGSGSIAANALTTTITVTLLDDNIEEADETFTVTLSEASGATISDATARGTIENDDTASLSIAAPSAVTEGDSSSMNMVFTVTLDSLSAQQVTVDYAVDAASTATSGTDHAALADGTLTFPAGTATQTVTVSVTGDERGRAGRDGGDQAVESRERGAGHGDGHRHDHRRRRHAGADGDRRRVLRGGPDGERHGIGDRRGHRRHDQLRLDAQDGRDDAGASAEHERESGRS